MSTTTTPDLSYPWRYTCPNGHHSWDTRSSGYHCRLCDTHFEALVDKKLAN